MGGAVEKMWFRLGQEFAAKGHTVFHISRRFPNLPDKETINGVQHIRIPGFDTPKSLLILKAYDLIYSLRFRSVVPENSDIVITNTFWAPVLLSSQLRKRTYVDVQRMPKGQMRYYKQSACLRANSNPVAQAIRDELPAEHHTRVSMIPNPLPFSIPDGFDPVSKKPCLLYCGRVHPEKGLEILIAAMAQLKDPWPLRVVGPWQTAQGGGGEDYLVKLRAMAEGLPVIFVGSIHDIDQLNENYRDASIFIYPSVAEKGETFGLAPLEAMAWGCAPVVSDLACFKDFIIDDENGHIFNHRIPKAASELAARIQTLMDDPTRRSQVALEAIKVRESHSSSTVADQFLKDFEKAVSHL